MNGNDQGMSIIEVIVSVVILGVLVSVISLSFNVLRAPKTSTVANMIGSYLEKTKLLTMSKANASYVVLYEGDDGIYMAITTSPDSFVKDTTVHERICKQDVTVRGVQEDGTEVKVKENQMLFVTFDHVTGSFKEEHSTGNYMEQIIVAYRDTTKKSVLQLVKATGKYYIK